MFNMLRILRGSPGRVHTMPQADLVASICIGMVNASAVLSCFSTYAAPSTRLRNFRPCSNSLSLIEVPLESPRAATRSEASAVRFERGGRDKELSFFYPMDATMASGNPLRPSKMKGKRDPSMNNKRESGALLLAALFATAPPVQAQQD